MTYLTHPQAPQTGQIERDPRGQSTSTDLSALSVRPSFMEAEIATPPSHTSESVQRKWERRSFDTGVVMTGRSMGRGN
jgi:hypothetical protein